MLTRAGVAKKLGKSIATVRRMEGVELHPKVDARGVHWFDIREVEAVQTTFRRDRDHRLGMAFSEERWRHATVTDDDEQTSDIEGADGEAAIGEHPNVAEARTWAEQARADAQEIRAERERIESMQRQAYSAHIEASRELARAQRELIAELNSCSPAVLRRLNAAERAEILALLQLDLQ